MRARTQRPYWLILLLSVAFAIGSLRAPAFVVHAYAGDGDLVPVPRSASHASEKALAKTGELHRGGAVRPVHRGDPRDPGPRLAFAPLVRGRAGGEALAATLSPPSVALAGSLHVWPPVRPTQSDLMVFLN